MEVKKEYFEEMQETYYRYLKKYITHHEFAYYCIDMIKFLIEEYEFSQTEED